MTWQTKLFGVLILVPIISIISYQKGKSAGVHEVKQYYAKLEQDNQKYWQNVVNRINESSSETRLKQQVKYESLNNEFIKISNNLGHCQYNVEQLRSIQSAANVRISTDSSMGNATRARESANSESFTAQDAGLTLIAWSKQFFSCKTKLDYLQALINPTQYNQNK